MNLSFFFYIGHNPRIFVFKLQKVSLSLVITSAVMCFFLLRTSLFSVLLLATTTFLNFSNMYLTTDLWPSTWHASRNSVCPNGCIIHTCMHARVLTLNPRPGTQQPLFQLLGISHLDVCGDTFAVLPQCRDPDDALSVISQPSELAIWITWFS